MSEENDNAENEGEGIKNLRKQYEAATKELADAKKLLGEFSAAKRQETVAELLKAKGVPASAAKLYNGEDVTEDAVGKWLEDYKDIFAVGSSADDENAKSAQRVNDASFGNASNTQNAGDRILGDPEEIQRALDTLPYDELVKLGYMPKQNIF